MLQLSLVSRRFDTIFTVYPVWPIQRHSNISKFWGCHGFDGANWNLGSVSRLVSMVLVKRSPNYTCWFLWTSCNGRLISDPIHEAPVPRNRIRHSC